VTALASSTTSTVEIHDPRVDPPKVTVFTPSVTGGKRPVMVWLHGGGFSSGSGSSPINDGTSLAHTSDVVVVTINHRLNVLGSTYLGGWSFDALQRAGRVEELSPGAVERADALFRTPQQPWCPEIF